MSSSNGDIDGAPMVDVGAWPETAFHVQVNDDAYNLPLLVENMNAINFSGFRLKISPSSWIDFNNFKGSFRINADQTPGSEFEVQPDGDAFISGDLTVGGVINTPSDRNLKTYILEIDYRVELQG